MSFSAFSHQVRDPRQPRQRRVSALRSCVQLYRPIGFEATLSFLEELAGPFQRDEHALPRALDHLAASRTLWREHLREYADQRRAAKRLGHRTLRADAANPTLGPPVWYGASRQAALHALTYWRRSRLPELLGWDDPGAGEIDLVVTACLAGGGSLSADHHRLLDTAVRQVRRRIGGGLYGQDVLAYFRARDLLRVAALVTNADDPESVARTAVDQV
ncbi:hypothetical protein AB0A95_25140 [Micromonospora sp. NPDC049230]|uniref:hypothetical protein n=1 Tax=Micromonospora sp. NPDC049230 TaxID=3155502 RepID=UPI0033E850B2